MKKSNLIVFVFILFLGGTVSTSLWLYVNIENQVDIPKEKWPKDFLKMGLRLNL